MALIAMWFSMSSVLYAQKDKLPPLIDRELLFDNPEIANGRLSPDGKFIAFIKPYKGTLNIWVKKFDEPFESAKPLTSDTTRPIRQYFWSRDSKYILYSQDKGGDENFNIYAVKPEEAKGNGQIPVNRDLTKLTGVRVFIYSVPKSDPDAIYIGLNDRDKAWHDLYKLKISTGERTLIRQNSETDRITEYVFDWDDKLRLAIRANQDGSNDILRVDNDKLEKIYSTNVFETAYPIAFNKDNSKVYLITNKGDDRNFLQLAILDPVTQKEELVESDPLNKVDIGNVVFSEVNRDIIFTTYEDDKERYNWRDKAFQADYETIRKELKGLEIYFSNSTEKEDIWLLSAYSDVDPGTTYLFDRKTKKLTYQYKPRPNIPVNDLAVMKPVKYKSSDGLEIPAYLTIPKGVEPKNLPVIVLPHGGP